MNKKDIKTRDDVYLLVTSFYKKVRADATLGPFFNTTVQDWEAHYELLTTFWESSLFLNTKYTGDPLKAHIQVDRVNHHAITELHFGIWLNLWYQTLDELFCGDYTENAKRRARKMGTFIYLKIFEARK